MSVHLRRLLTAVSAVSLFAVSTACYAWDTDVTETREVYRDNLTVKMAGGKLGHAVLAFTVTATSHVGENGNAKFPDNRACYYNDVRRTLVRTLVFTSPDGVEIPVRDTTVALPNASGKSWGVVTTCNDKIGEIHSNLVSATGSASTWQTYIDGEKADAAHILSQFGQVT